MVDIELIVIKLVDGEIRYDYATCCHWKMAIVCIANQMSLKMSFAKGGHFVPAQMC